MAHDPANNFDDSILEIAGALHASMKIKGGDYCAGWDDGDRLTVTVTGDERRMIQLLMKEFGRKITPLLVGQMAFRARLDTPSAIAKGKVR